MNGKYNKPPITEALCEFRFRSGSDWDPTVWGLLYQSIKDSYPTKRQARHLQVSLNAQAEGVSQNLQTTERMQFLSEDEKSLVQVGPDLLAVNFLAPYPSWEVMRPAIDKALTSYRRIAEPIGLTRIGLRYINQIEIPETMVESEAYFNFYPHVGPDLPQEHGPLVCGVQFPYADGRDILKLQLATDVPSSGPEWIAFNLDLDYFVNEADNIDFGHTMEWVDEAHSAIGKTFEAAITEKLRDLFGKAE
jgi:uncharacterized protein (TIGR04255 family)